MIYIKSFCISILFYLLLYCRIKIVYTNTVNFDNLIAKSNIYYQQPLQKGVPGETPINDIENLTSKEDIKVIVHGFMAHRNHSSITPIKYAYLAQSKNNILMADWCDAAQSDYARVRRSVHQVAIILAKLLANFINKHNIERSEIHIIGHSLGAHIAGGIGKYFNGSLGRITGLDPALPLFAPTSLDSLKANAAQFVDVIHTDYPIFGDITPRGTVDFYPNYGYTGQIGCDDLDLITASKLLLKAYSCSHNRAVLLYAESINMPYNFPSIPCSLYGIVNRNVGVCYQKLKEMNLSLLTLSQAIADRNDSIVVYMGEKVSKSVTGIYYLETSGEPPYGYGLYTYFL